MPILRQECVNLLISLAGSSEQRGTPHLKTEAKTPSGNNASLVIVGKPGICVYTFFPILVLFLYSMVFSFLFVVARVYPSVKRSNDQVDRNHLLQDYLDRRLAAARNRAKLDNRSYGVACALGRVPSCNLPSFQISQFLITRFAS